MLQLSSFNNHFGDLASQYASSRPGYPRALFDYLGSLAKSQKLAWDCGAGNGQASLGLATVFDRVIATDASQEQVRCAAAHPRIEYRVSTAEDSRLESGSIDLVLVAQALHWFNLDSFYKEATRVLKPGGVLAAVTYGPLVVDDPSVDPLIQMFYHDWVGSFWPPERRHVENNYRDIAFPFPKIQAPTIEMSAHWTVDQLLGYLRSWSATDACSKATGSNPVDRLKPMLEESTGFAGGTLRINWPLTVLAGYVSA